MNKFAVVSTYPSVVSTSSTTEKKVPVPEPIPVPEQKRRLVPEPVEGTIRK